MADLATATDVGPRLRLPLEIGVSMVVVASVMAFVFSQRDVLIARTQSLEAFAIWQPVRADLVAYRAQHGQWPRSVDEVDSEGLTTDRPGNIARAIELGDGGALTVVFDNERPVQGLRGRRLTFRPALPTADPGAPMIWLCGSHRVPEGFTPSGRDLSDLSPAYLPSPCKDFPRP